MSASSRISITVERVTDVGMGHLAHEEETFEDDPMEYIRTDLEPSTGKRL